MQKLAIAIVTAAVLFGSGGVMGQDLESGSLTGQTGMSFLTLPDGTHYGCVPQSGGLQCILIPDGNLVVGQMGNDVAQMDNDVALLLPIIQLTVKYGRQVKKFVMQAIAAGVTWEVIKSKLREGYEKYEKSLQELIRIHVTAKAAYEQAVPESFFDYEVAESVLANPSTPEKSEGTL